jgi:hypothetical protein
MSVALFTKKFFLGKKGLAIAQVFIFILAAFTFSMIMIFGYRAIEKLLVVGEETQMVDFENGLKNAVERIYTESKSLRVEKFYVPGDYQEICFIDLDYPAEKIDLEKGSLCQRSPSACQAWEEASLAQKSGKSGYASGEENVFLEPSQAGMHPLKVYRITLIDTAGKESGFLCSPLKKGAFSLMLEGKGDHAELSSVN